MKIIFGNHNRFSFLRTMRMISVNMWKHPAKIYWFNYSLFISYYSIIRTQSIFVLNPIFDGVWCRCHTLQLLKHNYSKMIHPTHTIIPYIWSHEYPLRLEPNFFSKFLLYLSYITCDEVNENSPSKIGLNNLKKLSLTKTLCGMVMSSLLIIFPRNKQTWFYPDKRVSETYFVQEMLFMA